VTQGCPDLTHSDVSVKLGDYLFISYATEDTPLADWLALKLTAEGYRVWYDRLHLLGGERFTRDITTAIRQESFRLLALVSKSSKEKDNPVSEWTLALAVGKQLKTDFLIPIRVELVPPAELPFILSNITWIPFDTSWATGLTQLLKKLEKIGAPQSTDGAHSLVTNMVGKNDFVVQKDERLYSNVIRIKKIPEFIHCFELSRRPSPPEFDMMKRTWPTYYVNNTKYLSFHTPDPLSVGSLTIHAKGSYPRRAAGNIEGIKTKNVISALLRATIEVKCYERGLKQREGNRSPGQTKWNVPAQHKKERPWLYFPFDLLPKNKIKFVHNQRNTSVLAASQRRKLGTTYRYYLSPHFVVRQDLFDPFCLLMRVRILITDQNGQTALPARSAVSCRKQLCKHWWNDSWLKRYNAILQYLADGKSEIVVGRGAEAVQFFAEFHSYDCGFGIAEEALERSRTDEEEIMIETLVYDEQAEEILSE
jgi:hypothetical protein